jgi:DNA repair exonuclease SbcCD ATPase subunit
MMIEIFGVAFVVALVVGTVAIAVDLSSMSIPALRNWLDLRGSELHRVLTLAFGGSRPRPAPPSGRPAASARLRGRNRLRPGVNHPARTAQRERTEAAAELAKQEAALAQRERALERSLADAERSGAEATARIEAREAVLATLEAELQQQESELADRHRSLAERERELIRTKADLEAPAEDLGAVESDWWEKQLGRSRSAKGARRPR